MLLVVLHDDRCAILRNNEMIHQAGGDADGIDGAVQRFMAMTQVTDVLGDDDGGDAGRGARADRSELRRDVDPVAPQPARGAVPDVTPPAAAPGTSA